MRFLLGASIVVLVACRATTPRAEDPLPLAEAPAPVVSAPAPPVEAAVVVDPCESARAPVPIGLDVASEAGIDDVVRGAIAGGVMPGAVVAIGTREGLLFLRAYGERQREPESQEMREDTIFDLASLTKPIATTIATMQLAERGRLRLDDPVARHLPAFAAGGKAAIRIAEILRHTSGLPAINALSEYDGGPAPSLARALATPPVEPPGRFRYSDVGFIALGALVEAVTGEALDVHVRANVLEPLGTCDMGFRPDASRRARAAATERRGDAIIVGEVDDPRAYRLGGVAGNAGLFGTAWDVARIARTLLRGGELDGRRVLDAASVAAMIQPPDDPNVPRALGWDLRVPPALRAGAFGHEGYTGVRLFVDPASDLFLVLLTNRVHPDGIRAPIQPLVDRLAELAVAARTRALDPARTVPVELGIDVLREDGFRALAGARVALLTHDAGRARDGRRTYELLDGADGVALVAIFAPEHGLRSDREGAVASTREPVTGVPVHSLFGATRSPTDAMLEGADTLVIDLQDVGVRFYTYASTMRLAMRAAAERGLRVVVLDRPNPLGDALEGPFPDPERLGFIHHHALPIRHGLTIGELATLLARDLGLPAPEVVRMRGYVPSMRWPETGLRWVAPSPNLPTFDAVVLYPGVALLEASDVCVGRGTDLPFRVLGAPWIRPEAWTSGLSLPGVRATPAAFTPRAATHRGQACQGIELAVDDLGALRPVRLGLLLVSSLARTHPGRLDEEHLARMLGAAEPARALLRAAPIDTIEASFRVSLDAFEESRRGLRLYGE